VPVIKRITIFCRPILCSGSSLCPVFVYKEYARHRPRDYSGPSDRFYLQPLKAPKNEIWFSKQPLGKNSLGNIASNMAAEAGFSGVKKTNHSARKTAIQTLLHQEVPPTSVMQLTGHKNVQSLNSYNSLSMDQQRNMSLTLSNQMPEDFVADAANDSSDPVPIPPSRDATTANRYSTPELPDDILVQLVDDFESHSAVVTPAMNLASHSVPQPMSFLTGSGNIFHGNINVNIYGFPPQKKRRISHDDDDDELEE